MSYANNPEITEEVKFSCAVAVHNGVYDHVYGSHQAVDIQVERLRKRFPGARLIRTYDDLPFSKVDRLRDGVEALNRGEKVDLDKIVK